MTAANLWREAVVNKVKLFQQWIEQIDNEKPTKCVAITEIWMFYFLVAIVGSSTGDEW